MRLPSSVVLMLYPLMRLILTRQRWLSAEREREDGEAVGKLAVKLQEDLDLLKILGSPKSRVVLERKWKEVGKVDERVRQS